LVDKVFNTSKFIINNDIISALFNAEMVTIAEAIGSLPRRRLSVTGNVAKVSIFCFQLCKSLSPEIILLPVSTQVN